nr:reverse transcriptase domain-containing protein [Tanacetum cinerariifolium]
VPWSSRLLRYAKSRPNGKLIHNSIINGPYVGRMIPEPGDTNRDVLVNETFHVQTNDELTEKELKQIEADDHAIQTILLGLPEDIYAAADSCETAQEIWLRVQQMMKGSNIGIQEKKAKVFNSPMLHVLRVEMVINSPWMLSKNWLVQKQMAFGKDMSNLFMADNLPKILLKFSKLAMRDLPEAIMVPISQRRSDRGTRFCNDQFSKVMIKYGVTHRLATSYHPQTSGQVEVSNRGLKRILERTVGENRTSWSDKLDNALWAVRTAYKTPIGCTPYKLVYGQSCHLPIELEHRAYWELKPVNFDLKTTGDHRKLQLNELSELRDQVYKNSMIYKERTKKLHDSKIKNRIFNVGDQVLLFNSRLKIFSGKLETCWSGPFTITRVFPYSTIELSQPNGLNFKVNGHRVKHYFGGDIPSNVAWIFTRSPWTTKFEDRVKLSDSMIKKQSTSWEALHAYPFLSSFYFLTCHLRKACSLVYLVVYMLSVLRFYAGFTL